MVDPYAFDPYAKPMPTRGSSSTPSPPSSSASASSTTDTTGTGSGADPADALRRQILDEALRRVPTSGWSEDSVRAAIAGLGLSPSLLSLLSSPLSALISHFHAQSTAASLSALSALPRDGLSTGEVLSRAVQLQLQQHVPYLAQLPQLIGLSLAHDRVSTTLSDIAEYVDRLWYAVGDESADMTWYSKRAVVGAVYVSAVLHLATDRSAGQKDTRAFLERRMREAESVQQAPDDISRALESYGGAAYQFALGVLQQQQGGATAGR